MSGSSLECLLRYKVVDNEIVFTILLPILLIWLFVHKQRLIATVVTFGYLIALHKSLGCMGPSNIVAHVVYVPPFVISAFIILFVLSFINISNIYVAYAVNAVSLLLVPVLVGIYFALIIYSIPTNKQSQPDVQVVSIGGVDVRGKPKEEVDAMLKKAIVPIRSL